MAKSNEESLMSLLGWVLCLVFVGIIFPLMAFLYIDILEAKHETQHQQKQIQKLINEAKEK